MKHESQPQSSTGAGRLAEGTSVVVPVYNSAQTLASLVERVARTLEPAAGDYEIVFVNDGSRDASWDAVRVLAGDNPFVHGINLMRNYGQHNALLCGIRAARYGVIVTMDDDLQNPPEEIPRLLEKLAEGFDVVYGTPQYEQHGLWRDLASRMTKYVLQEAMGAETAGKVSAFRAFRTGLRAVFGGYCSSHVCLDVLLTWSTTSFTSITVRHDQRKAGESNYTVRKLFAHAVNMLTGFDTGLLRVASVLGIGFSFVGLLVIMYVLVRFFVSGNPVRGFPFLASIIAVFSGAQLLSLGIVGEYLARMHYRMMDRPTYGIRADTESEISPTT